MPEATLNCEFHRIQEIEGSLLGLKTFNIGC